MGINTGSVANLATAGADAATGNIAGAVTLGIEAFIGLFSGHSNWYKADQALQAQNWQAVASFYNEFYTTPSFNANNQGGFNGDLDGYTDSDLIKGPMSDVKRYTLLSTVYNQTGAAEIYQMYLQAVSEALIPPDPTVIAPGAGVAAQVTAVLPGQTATAADAAATNTTAATAATATTAAPAPDYTIWVVLGLVAVAGFIIWLTHKKK